MPSPVHRPPTGNSSEIHTAPLDVGDPQDDGRHDNGREGSDRQEKHRKCTYDDAEYSTKSFVYTKCITTRMLLDSPIKKAFLDHLPNPRPELEDVTVMALVIFMQIIYNISASSLGEWDHSSLKSRVAVAVSCGLALKFIMDDQPHTSMYFLSCVVRRDELIEDDEKVIADYVVKYETCVLKSLNLYRCCYNHRSWAADFLYMLKKNKEMTSFTCNRVYELVYFVSLHVCELLPDFEAYDEEHVAEAIVLLSVECIQISAWPGVITKSKILAGHRSYEVATKIGHTLADKRPSETQGLLGEPFTLTSQWQHRATLPCSLRRAAYDLEKKLRMSLPDSLTRATAVCPLRVNRQ